MRRTWPPLEASKIWVKLSRGAVEHAIICGRGAVAIQHNCDAVAERVGAAVAKSYSAPGAGIGNGNLGKGIGGYDQGVCAVSGYIGAVCAAPGGRAAQRKGVGGAVARNGNAFRRQIE